MHLDQEMAARSAEGKNLQARLDVDYGHTAPPVTTTLVDS
jgi:hypothetical protein